MKRIFLLCALIVSGCAGPRQQYTTEAVAAQKEQARAGRHKELERENQTLRLEVRKLYVNDHPELSAKFRKAILKEKIKAGMTPWQVIAAYSLWEYTTDPSGANYKSMGAPALWALADRRQTPGGQSQQEYWVLKRDRNTRYVYFQNGAVTEWKD
jgi:hypothetical protein